MIPCHPKTAHNSHSSRRVCHSLCAENDYLNSSFNLSTRAAVAQATLYWYTGRLVQDVTSVHRTWLRGWGAFDCMSVTGQEDNCFNPYTIVHFAPVYRTRVAIALGPSW